MQILKGRNAFLLILITVAIAALVVTVASSGRGESEKGNEIISGKYDIIRIYRMKKGGSGEITGDSSRSNHFKGIVFINALMSGDIRYKCEYSIPELDLEVDTEFDYKLEWIDDHAGYFLGDEGNKIAGFKCTGNKLEIRALVVKDEYGKITDYWEVHELVKASSRSL